MESRGRRVLALGHPLAGPRACPDSGSGGRACVHADRQVAWALGLVQPLSCPLSGSSPSAHPGHIGSVQARYGHLSCQPLAWTHDHPAPEEGVGEGVFFLWCSLLVSHSGLRPQFPSLPS